MRVFCRSEPDIHRSEEPLWNYPPPQPASTRHSRIQEGKLRAAKIKSEAEFQF